MNGLKRLWYALLGSVSGWLGRQCSAWAKFWNLKEIRFNFKARRK